MPTAIRKVFQWGDQTVTLETGEIARQAHGAVMASIGDTTVLATVVGARSERPGIDFFPLTVDYQERTYAAGRIPGGFFRREGRPSEKEILTSRLIDRPIRPLFPKGFRNEVQVIVTVKALDPQIDPDVVAMIGASAALSLSGIPFKGPVGAARVGYVDGQYVLNPPLTTTKEISKLDLVVAGTENAVLMVESEAKGLSEDVMLGAVMFGHEQAKVVIKAIRELVAEVGVAHWDWQAKEKDPTVAAAVAAAAEAKITEVYAIPEKLARLNRLSELRAEVVEALAGGETPEHDPEAVKGAFSDLEKKIVRGRILAGERRIDGRDTRTVRPISVRTGVLPRTHGSALFTRGETQALVISTLGSERDSQIIDALEGERRDPFLLHYNFPPFCVGETGRVGSPKRREIGHGKLAKRAIAAVWRSSPTPCAWCRKSPSPTARAPWPRCAAPACR